MEDNTKVVKIMVPPDEGNGLAKSMQKRLSSLQQGVNIYVSPDEMDGLLPTSMRKSPSSESPHSNSDKCCIYKVPEYILKKKEEFYQPKVISICPAFYKQDRLEAMQELKWIYLEAFLQHPDNENRSVDSYINKIREMKNDIRDCYQDQTMLSSCGDDDEEFIHMILLDAAFLLCLFLTSLTPRNRLSFEYRPRVPRKLQQSHRFMETDLLILENQIPFFVIKAMFELAFPSEPTSELIVVARLQIKWFNIPRGKYVEETEIPNTADEIAHLLDLYRKCCCLHVSDRLPLENKEAMQYPGTVKQLSAAGVKFKRSHNLNPLCIEFNKDTSELLIPHLIANKKTEAFLRNLLQFEQCHYYYYQHAYFSDLIFFLDSLIDTAEDIQMLQESGIIRNVLGSDEMAATLFNNLTANIMTRVKRNHYSDVGKQVKAYANKPWNRWKAILRRDYFAHPWAIISFIFAVLFFGLTVVQTVSNFMEN